MGYGWVWYKTLCEYHAWCRARGPRSGWFRALLEAAREFEQDAPPAVRALLDVTALGRGIPCDVMRDILRAASSTVGTSADARRIDVATYALERATPDVFALCTPADLEPLLTSENGRARAYALLALAHVHP